ncbi:unnamed protein product [Allacma fusca]|uniref:Large ribosomal subunit protein mL40 n=1 Tax=Allacma fusca TaxID=39272 RepID=A0A8J2PTP5_9HEXA|nr:unnamed protein product [Allacma fusca]
MSFLLGSFASSKLLNLTRFTSVASAVWPKSLWPSNDGVRSIATSPILLAEPLKKKKRLDPAIAKAREQRKQRRLEKEIRKLQKHARQLKPLDELQIPVQIQDNPKQRERRLPQLTTSEMENRWLLEMEMSKFKHTLVMHEYRAMENLMSSQQKALTELRNVSEDLYQAAIAIDETYIPFQSTGPVETPPFKDYNTPEGDYIDISRNWEK